MTYTILKIRWDNCPWCNVLKPIYEEAKNNNKREDIDFLELKTEDDMVLVEVLKVRTVPTIIIRKENEEVARKSGAQMPKELQERIDLHTKI